MTQRLVAKTEFKAVIDEDLMDPEIVRITKDFIAGANVEIQYEKVPTKDALVGGVYAMVVRDAAPYVGQARNIRGRLQIHQSEGKKILDAVMLVSDEEAVRAVDSYDATLIDRLLLTKPRFVVEFRTLDARRSAVARTLVEAWVVGRFVTSTKTTMEKWRLLDERVASYLQCPSFSAAFESVVHEAMEKGVGALCSWKTFKSMAMIELEKAGKEVWKEQGEKSFLMMMMLEMVIGRAVEKWVDAVPDPVCLGEFEEAARLARSGAHADALEKLQGMRKTYAAPSDTDWAAGAVRVVEGRSLDGVGLVVSENHTVDLLLKERSDLGKVVMHEHGIRLLELQHDQKMIVSRALWVAVSPIPGTAHIVRLRAGRDALAFCGLLCGTDSDVYAELHALLCLLFQDLGKHVARAAGDVSDDSGVLLVDADAASDSQDEFDEDLADVQLDVLFIDAAEAAETAALSADAAEAETAADAAAHRATASASTADAPADSETAATDLLDNVDELFVALCAAEAADAAALRADAADAAAHRATASASTADAPADSDDSLSANDKYTLGILRNVFSVLRPPLPMRRVVADLFGVSVEVFAAMLAVLPTDVLASLAAAAGHDAAAIPLIGTARLACPGYGDKVCTHVAERKWVSPTGETRFYCKSCVVNAWRTEQYGSWPGDSKCTGCNRGPDGRQVARTGLFGELLCYYCATAQSLDPKPTNPFNRADAERRSVRLSNETCATPECGVLMTTSAYCAPRHAFDGAWHCDGCYKHWLRTGKETPAPKEPKPGGYGECTHVDIGAVCYVCSTVKVVNVQYGGKEKDLPDGVSMWVQQGFVEITTMWGTVHILCGDCRGKWTTNNLLVDGRRGTGETLKQMPADDATAILKRMLNPAGSKQYDLPKTCMWHQGCSSSNLLMISMPNVLVDGRMLGTTEGFTGNTKPVWLCNTHRTDFRKLAAEMRTNECQALLRFYPPKKTGDKTLNGAQCVAKGCTKKRDKNLKGNGDVNKFKWLCNKDGVQAVICNKRKELLRGYRDTGLLRALEYKFEGYMFRFEEIDALTLSVRIDMSPFIRDVPTASSTAPSTASSTAPSTASSSSTSATTKKRSRSSTTTSSKKRKVDDPTTPDEPNTSDDDADDPTSSKRKAKKPISKKAALYRTIMGPKKIKK